MITAGDSLKFESFVLNVFLVFFFQLFGLADTRIHTQTPVLMDSMEPLAHSNSILARRMLKLKSTLFTAKIVKYYLGS